MSDSSLNAIFSAPLSVRAGHHARISFNVNLPSKAALVIRHLRRADLLASERRPLTPGDRALEIKTHPDCSHVACALYSDAQPVLGVRFDVECGTLIEPTARNFIIIGAMKAGTTTLFELLAQHPAICRSWAELPGVSFTKEINYFRKTYQKGDTPLHYDWRFPFVPTRHAWTLEASPNYTKWPGSKGVPARIASLGGNTKLAYILREPVDRIESHLAHTLHGRGKLANMQHCIRTSRYAMQLDKFMRHFDRDDVLLLDFQELQRDPARLLAEICDFLSIEHFVGDTVVHNRRSVDFRLDARQRKELADMLRSDVQRLISVYGFRPAESWGRRSPLDWIRRSAFR